MQTEKLVAELEDLIEIGKEILRTYRGDVQDEYGVPYPGYPADAFVYERWRMRGYHALKTVYGVDTPPVVEFGRATASNAIFRSELIACIAKLETAKHHIDSGMLPKHAPATTTSPAPIERLLHLLNRFHGVASQLRHRHGNRDAFLIADEYDVQDLLHALLTVDFEDIREEEHTPSYAGGASRVDFLLKDEQIVVEVKKTRESMTAKDLGGELVVDIARYRVHPDCKMLVCFVYDPDSRIKNPRGIENDLSKAHDGLTVKVVIRPRF